MELNQAIPPISTMLHSDAGEQRYRQIFEDSPVSIWEKDLSRVAAAVRQLKAIHGANLRDHLHQNTEEVRRLMTLIRIKDTNEASLKMFEADRKEDLLHSLSLLFTTEAIPAFIEELIAIADRKESFESEYALQTLKGRKIWCLVKTRLPQNGDYSSVLVSRFDITDRKKAEERFRGTFDNAAVGIAHVGLDGQWLMVNDRLCQIVGYPKEELLQKTFQDITHPEDLEADLHLLHQLHEGDIDTYSMEKRYRHKDNTLVWCNLTASMVRDTGGLPKYYIAIVQDIDLRKAAEAALRESEDRYRTLAGTLEHTVDKRTAELKRSNEDLQQFAHVASHDLKEPVRKIRTFSDRLRSEFESLLPERAKLYLSKIESSAERIYAMINGVLLYSSLDANEQAFESVDLAQIVREISTDLEVPISEKGAVLRQTQLPAVKGSPVLLYQLFYNLINNSLKFARPSVAPEITIEAEKTADGRYWKITVQDNGIGFSEEESGRLFQTFFRLHPKDKYEGTGLGLALCKKIAERHNGGIAASGVEGSGSKFTITLPA